MTTHNKDVTVLLTNFNVPERSRKPSWSTNKVSRCTKRDVEVEGICEGLLLRRNRNDGLTKTRTSGAPEAPYLLRPHIPNLTLLLSWTSKLPQDILGGPLGTHYGQKGKEKKGGIEPAHSYRLSCRYWGRNGAASLHIPPTTFHIMDPTVPGVNETLME